MNDFVSPKAHEQQEVEPASEQEQDEVEIEESPENSIGSVIDCFLHRVLDIEDCAEEFIRQSVDKYNQNGHRLVNDIRQCQEIINSGGKPDNSSAAIRELRKLIREAERHNKSSIVNTIERSLFVSLFASFDKFVGDLVNALYFENTDLYKNINREVPLSEILKFDSIESLKNSVLDKEIETLRRKSYTEQFSDLEKRFSIKLTKFDKWPAFVESSQRRNLFTHCDGVVSKQYIDVCTENNYKLDEQLKVGDQLSIGPAYLFSSCETITEVAVMLGQTLWRKTNPKNINKADSHLNSLIFDFLHMEQWRKAIPLSKFALNLPEHSGDQILRMLHVNYAIALKSIGETKAAKSILDRKDWGAVSYDFRLAYAVLTEDYQNAKILMSKIGSDGELIREMAYHDWPLFREFRETTEFLEGYENVYGYKYATKLTLLAEESSIVIEQA